jgi:thymidylate synthase
MLKRSPKPKPKTTVAAAGPFCCCVMLTLIDGRRVIVEGFTPIVVNSSDAEAKAFEEQRDAYKAEKNRQYAKTHYYKVKDTKRDKKKYKAIAQLSDAIAGLMKISEGRRLTREEWHEVVAARSALKKYLRP